MAITYLSGERIQGIAAPTPTRQSDNMDSIEFATVSGGKFQFTLPSTDGTMPSTSTGYGGDTMTWDIGSALSDAAWVARCKVTFTTMDLNDTDASMNGFGFWISDTANGNVDVGSQDWASIVGMRVQNADGNTSTGAMMGGRIRDNSQPETHFTTGDSNCPVVGTSAFSATTYYVQATRDDDDLVTTIGTNSYGGTTGGGTQTVTQANVTGLRYLKFTVFSEFRSAGDPDGTVIGNIDDFSIDDGVTTYATADITQASLLSDDKDTISNIPVGTRYEETDTRKIFRRVVGKTFSQPNTNNQQEIYPPTGSSRTEVCQLYQTGQVLVGNAVTKASFFIRDAEVGGTATGNIKAYIRRIDGTEVEESTTEVNAANLTTSYEEKEFNFPATTIDANDMICINSDELTNGQVQVHIYNTAITNGLTYMRIGSTYSIDSNKSIKMNVTYDSWVEKGTA